MAESWSIEEEKQLQALMAKKVVAANESRGAAMSDGSKRRYVDEESVGSMDNPWIEVTEKSHLKVDYTSVELDLPMGITSMEQWGRTVISFGKYAEANVTYNEMLTAPEYAGYRKWCKSHLTTHTAGKVAMDFVKYRDAYEKKSNKDSGLLFPGTEVERRFKWAIYVGSMHYELWIGFQWNDSWLGASTIALR